MENHGRAARGDTPDGQAHPDPGTEGAVVRGLVRNDGIRLRAPALRRGAVRARLGLQSGRADATAPRGGDVLTGAWRFRTRRRRSTRYYQTYFSHKPPKLWGD